MPVKQGPMISQTITITITSLENNIRRRNQNVVNVENWLKFSNYTTIEDSTRKNSLVDKSDEVSK